MKLHTLLSRILRHSKTLKYMICYQPASRKERRTLYQQALHATDTPVRIDYKQFRELDPKIANQIHVDSKRSMWHLFKKETLEEHLKQSQINIEIYPNENVLIRFHQRYLELFTLDVIANRKNSQYFQGLNQILAVFYFIFLKEEYLGTTAQIQEYQKVHDPERNDYDPINQGIDEVVYDYDQVLQMALVFCNRTLVPLFEQDLTQLASYVKLSFEPLLRFFDARIYNIISKTQSLHEIAPSLLMGALLSAFQYNSQNLSSALRFMDASVHGDWIMQLFIAAAAMSIAVRYRNPSLFPNQEFKLQLNNTEAIQGLQIAQDADDDMLFRVMTALDNAEKIVKDYANETIRLAMVGFYVACSAESMKGAIFDYINNQLDIQNKIVIKFKFENKLEQYKQTYCQKFIDGLRGVDGQTQHFTDLIMQSVSYDIENKIEVQEMDFAKQAQARFLKVTGFLNKGMQIAWDKTKIGGQFIKKNGEIAVQKTKELVSKAMQSEAMTKSVDATKKFGKFVGKGFMTGLNFLKDIIVGPDETKVVEQQTQITKVAKEDDIV